MAVCFLFYKTQYDKLYNVLQVLEFFGSSEGPAGVPVMCPLHAAPAVARPSAFQIMGAGMAVYSAFCGGSGSGVKDEGPCAKVAVLGAVLKSREADMGRVRCKLWYESSRKPLEAIASYVVEEKEEFPADGFRPMRVHCESKYTDTLPFGVALLVDEGSVACQKMMT